MKFMTRPALESAKAFMRDVAEAQRMLDAGDTLGGRRRFKMLAANAPSEIAVLDASIAVLDAAEAGLVDHLHGQPSLSRA